MLHFPKSFLSPLQSDFINDVSRMHPIRTNRTESVNHLWNISYITSVNTDYKDHVYDTIAYSTMIILSCKLWASIYIGVTA